MTYRIADILLDWYSREGRDLPWRRTRDPYRIWLSEVILQQTRVAQGTEYYLRFVGRFPDVRSLAAASEDEVLKLWQGLGYYSRARNLHAAARQVVDDFGGRFPTTFAGVRSLRGVGDYTAAAVCSAAYSLPYAAVDGNVYRVLSRLFDIAEPIDTASGRRLFAELARSQLDERDPGRYNQAIMDFGALRCTPSPPRCGECPFGDRCLALAAGTVVSRPVKQGRTQVRDRWFHYLHITSGRADPVVPPFGTRHLAGFVRVSVARNPGGRGFRGAVADAAFRGTAGRCAVAAARQYACCATPAFASDDPCGFPPHRDPFAYACRRSAGRSDRDVGRLCRAAAYRPLPDELPEVEGVSGQE